jgi:hypothetical protein
MACYNHVVRIEFILALLSALRVFFRSRHDPAIEILALRQQVSVLKRKRPRPTLTGCSGRPCAACGPGGPTSSSS